MNTNALTTTTTATTRDGDDRGAEALEGATARRSGGAASRGGRRGACRSGSWTACGCRPGRPAALAGGPTCVGFGQGWCSVLRRRSPVGRSPSRAGHGRACAPRRVAAPRGRRSPFRRRRASGAQGSLSQPRTSGRVRPKNSRPARSAAISAPPAGRRGAASGTAGSVSVDRPEREPARRLLALEHERRREDRVREQDHRHDPDRGDRRADRLVDDPAQGQPEQAEDEERVAEEDADAAGHRAQLLEHGRDHAIGRRRGRAGRP